VSDIHPQGKIHPYQISGRLHDYEIVILQDQDLDQPPVVSYFTRYGRRIFLYKKHCHSPFADIRYFWNITDLCLQVGAHLRFYETNPHHISIEGNPKPMQLINVHRPLESRPRRTEVLLAMPMLVPCQVSGPRHHNHSESTVNGPHFRIPQHPKIDSRSRLPTYRPRWESALHIW
jgi:hypothetical protein